MPTSSPGAVDLSLGWERPVATLNILVDPDGPHDVVHHLLDNAIKFTEAGGTVTARLRGIDDAIVIEVADTGIGMEPDRVPELFEPFRQGSTVTVRLP